MFTVYVLHSLQTDKIYVGYTSDLESRLESHNHLSNKGWTIKFRPWKIVHQETFHLKSEATRREKELKSATGRRFIRSVILNELVRP